MSCKEIKDQVYCIYDYEITNGFNGNLYLLNEGEEVLLFDPCSILNFEIIVNNLKKLINLERIKYIVLDHADPDFCCTVQLLKKAGVKATIITSWRTMTLIEYYGVQYPIYLIEDHDMRFVFKSGRTLEFILTPDLHFAGSFVTYDVTDKLLFSGDLFGAFSHSKTLFADDRYMSKMLSFHELYIPSSSYVRPFMEVLQTYEINCILPQHGSVICNNIKDYILTLKNFGFGDTPVKKDLMKSGGYLMIFNEINRKLRSIYSTGEVNNLFKLLSDLVLSENGEIINYNSDGEKVWDDIFKEIIKQKGISWIMVLEPFVRKLSAVYDIKLPHVFDSIVREMVSENLKLKEQNYSLNQTVKEIKNKLVICPVTGLYNEVYLKNLLTEELSKGNLKITGDLVSISIDNFSDYQLNYGVQEEHNALNNLTYMLRESFGNNTVHRLGYTEFALYVSGVEKNDLINRLDLLRIAIPKSSLFLGGLTISVGVAFHDEIEKDNSSQESMVQSYLNLSLNRLRVSKARGKNMINYHGQDIGEEPICGKVLIVDSDEANLELLRSIISEEGIPVLTARDGLEAYDIAVLNKPQIIISELILNKMDGFMLREQILKNSETKNIEMIFLSYQKDETSVERAMSLGIDFFLKKPYILSEVVGIVKRRVKRMM